MGHDILIGGRDIYISFNWTCFSDIWHISNIHGHDNIDGRVSKSLKEAIEKLAEMGYVPQKDPKVDSWCAWLPDTVIEKGMKVMTVIGGKRVTGLVVEKRLDQVKIDINIKSTYADIAKGKKDSFIIINVSKVSRVPDFKSFDAYCMFADILTWLLEIADENTTEVWKSDQVFKTKKLYGVDPVDEFDSDDDDSDE